MVRTMPQSERYPAFRESTAREFDRVWKAGVGAVRDQVETLLNFINDQITLGRQQGIFRRLVSVSELGALKASLKTFVEEESADGARRLVLLFLDDLSVGIAHTQPPPSRSSTPAVR